MREKGSRLNGLLPKSLFACSETFFDLAYSRQCQRPSGSNSWHCCSSASPGFMNKKRYNEPLTGILVWVTASKHLTVEDAKIHEGCFDGVLASSRTTEPWWSKKEESNRYGPCVLLNRRNGQNNISQGFGTGVVS